MREGIPTGGVTAGELARKPIGDSSDIEMIAKLLRVEGLTMVDVGCGAGATSRELVARGATVLGVEPDPIQAAKNGAAPAIPNLTFVEARAESLPVESNSVDGVFFFRSLHHVPPDHMDDALAEAARVLKPNSGFLWVVEPAMTGSHFPVMRPFNDETEVRSLAQAALARTAASLFEDEEDFEYEQHPRYENFEALITRITSQTFQDITREDIERDEVRALFEAGRAAAGDYVFDQPMLLNLYRGAKA